MYKERRVFLQSFLSLPFLSAWENKTQENFSLKEPFAVEQFSSAKGFPLWLAESQDTPVFSLSFSFAGGSSRDPEGQKGLSYFLASMLPEGAGNLDSGAFRRRLEATSIGINFSVTRDFFQGQLFSLASRRKEAFDLLASALLSPQLGAKPLERNRRQILTTLKRQKQDPQSLAWKELFAHLFPKDPYRYAIQGLEEDVKALSREDLLAWKNTWLTQRNLQISAAGAITPQELSEGVDRVFAQLSLGENPPPLPQVKGNFSGKTIHIERDIPQSFVLCAQEGLAISDPNFVQLQVLNHVLGGAGFGSRLFEEIREKEGLAYHVSCWLRSMSRSSLWMISLGTEQDRLQKSLKILQRIWRDTAKGPTEEEVTLAKQYLIGSFALQFQDSPRISGYLNFLRENGLDLHYLEKRNRKIRSVTTEQLRAFSSQILRPQDLTFAIAGKSGGARKWGG